MQIFYKSVTNVKKHEEKIAQNKNSRKEIFRILKSLGMLSKAGRESEISLKENDVISFDSEKNGITFVGFSQT